MINRSFSNRRVHWYLYGVAKETIQLRLYKTMMLRKENHLRSKLVKVHIVLRRNIFLSTIRSIELSTRQKRDTSWTLHCSRPWFADGMGLYHWINKTLSHVVRSFVWQNFNKIYPRFPSNITLFFVRVILSLVMPLVHCSVLVNS